MPNSLDNLSTSELITQFKENKRKIQEINRKITANIEEINNIKVKLNGGLNIEEKKEKY